MHSGILEGSDPGLSEFPLTSPLETNLNVPNILSAQGTADDIRGM